MRRALGVLVAAVLAAAAAAVAGLGALVAWNLPDLSFPRIPGLEGKVSVSFDDRGVATVTSGSVGDALRAQGYLTARERLFQMELQRRASGGELSEILGKAALPSDRIHRIYGFSRVAEAAVPLLPAAEREDVEALTDGINAFVESRAGRWGLEFALLRLVPKRYTPADALRVLLLMCEDLSSSWRKDLARERLLKGPAAVRLFVTSRFTADDFLLVPDGAKPELPSLPELQGSASTGALGLAPTDAPEENFPGSNAWAVSGDLTKSGKPILASDPHLGLNMPGIWLPMRFVIGGRLVEGVTVPGLPGVILGRSEHVAWAFTNLYADVEDLYREMIVEGKAKRGSGWETVREREETIRVRGEANERVLVRETSHGPLVAGNLALKWVALDPANLRLLSARILRAADSSEVKRALDEFPEPALNVVYADAEGGIGWRASGLVPTRRPGTDGSVPYDGSDSSNDWSGFVPPREMPKSENPGDGYLVSANQRAAGTSSSHALSSDWPSPARARRIASLLQAGAREGRKLDRAGAEAIQLDTASPVLAATMEALASLLPPEWAARFRGWDGRADAASAPFLVARVFRRKLGERVLALWRVPPEIGLAEHRLLDLARADDAAFQRAGLGPKAALVGRAFSETLAEISTRSGGDPARARWGDANRLDVRHPLGRLPGLSWLFDPPSFPQSGATGVVRAASGSFGQSMRFIVDWGAPEETTLVVPFGVSGHVGSSHRFDQLPLWRGGDPSGLSTRLSGPARERTVLTP